jgi:hypothetical protein
VARLARNGADERSPQYFHRNANITPPFSAKDDLDAYFITTKRKTNEIEEREFATSEMDVDSELKKSKTLTEKQERQKRKDRLREIRAKETGVPIDPHVSTFSSTLPYSSPFIPLVGTASTAAAATLSGGNHPTSAPERKKAFLPSTNALPGEAATLTPTLITPDTSHQATSVILNNRFFCIFLFCLFLLQIR